MRMLSSGEAMRTDGVGPDRRKGSAARLGVRLCKIMAGVRGFPTHVEDQCTLFQCLSCHAVLQKLRPTRKRAGRGNYRTLYTWNKLSLNSPARNEEHRYRAPKATNVDRSIKQCTYSTKYIT